MEVVMNLPGWLSSILVWTFWDFKLKVLKYPRNFSLHNTLIQLNLVIRNCLIRNLLVLRNHFLWPNASLLYKDKEHLALRNNFRVTEKFLSAKFDCALKSKNSCIPYCRSLDCRSLNKLNLFHISFQIFDSNIF